MTTPSKVIAELVQRHGSLRAVGRVLKLDCGFLCRIRAGTQSPSKAALRKLGLRAVVSYQRTR